MAAASTFRTRRCRQRARDGMIMIPVVVNLERVRDILLGAELLAEWDDDDRRAIAERCSPSRANSC